MSGTSQHIKNKEIKSKPKHEKSNNSGSIVIPLLTAVFGILIMSYFSKSKNHGPRDSYDDYWMSPKIK